MFNVHHLKFVTVCFTHFFKQAISLPCSNSPLPFPILSHRNPIHVFTSCFRNIHFNIVPPIYVFIFQVGYFLQVSLPKFPSPGHVPHSPAHPHWFDHPNCKVNYCPYVAYLIVLVLLKTSKYISKIRLLFTPYPAEVENMVSSYQC